MTEPFADHFSAAASDYSQFRPRYPDSLFDYLASLVADRDLAWDCATGNGQAAAPLALRFKRVVASDASPSQIAQARTVGRVSFIVARAESAPLDDACANLLTVGQALHWFDLEAFFREARRVLRPEGVFAAWTYDLCRVNAAVDGVVTALYHDILGAYWPAQRRLVEDAYDGIEFPFTSPTAVTLQMSAVWTPTALLSYLGTWSAVKRYRDDRLEDPVAGIRAALEQAWGTAESRTVTWPLRVWTGRR